MLFRPWSVYIFRMLHHRLVQIQYRRTVGSILELTDTLPFVFQVLCSHCYLACLQGQQVF